MKYILYVLLFIFICIANINYSIANVDFNNNIKISCACNKNKKDDVNTSSNKTILPMIHKMKANSECQNKNNTWLKFTVQNSILNNIPSPPKGIPDITNKQIKKI